MLFFLYSFALGENATDSLSGRLDQKEIVSPTPPPAPPRHQRLPQGAISHTLCTALSWALGFPTSCRLCTWLPKCHRMPHSQVGEGWSGRGEYQGRRVPGCKCLGRERKSWLRPILFHCSLDVSSSSTFSLLLSSLFSLPLHLPGPTSL